METVTTYSVVRLKPVREILVERCRLECSNWVKSDDYLEWVESNFNLSRYRYFWFEDIVSTKTTGVGIVTFRTKVHWCSGRYFINAYIEEYDDVVVNNKELARRMDKLGWTHIVKSLSVKEHWVECFDPERDKLIEYSGV